MVNYILCDDLIDQMVEELSYIKLKTAIELEKKKWFFHCIKLSFFTDWQTYYYMLEYESN